MTNLNDRKKKYQFLSFEKAREVIRGLNISDTDGWREFCASGDKPDNIPSNPWRVYKGKGWKGMGDWLGTYSKSSRQKSKEFVTFEEARAFVRKLQLVDGKAWKEYARSGKKPDNIPSNPYSSYAEKGWTNWYDFLGRERPNKVDD